MWRRFLELTQVLSVLVGFHVIKIVIIILLHLPAPLIRSILGRFLATRVHNYMHSPRSAWPIHYCWSSAQLFHTNIACGRSVSKFISLSRMGLQHVRLVVSTVLLSRREISSRFVRRCFLVTFVLIPIRSILSFRLYEAKIRSHPFWSCRVPRAGSRERMNVLDHLCEFWQLSGLVVLGITNLSVWRDF